MNRKALWAIVAIGLALVIAPLAMSLPSKSAAGERMLNNFQPIMQPAQVRKTVHYYNKTFVPLRGVAIGGVQAGNESAKLVQALAQALKMTPAQVQQFLASQFPATASLIGNLPDLKPVFENVPPGLDHYKPLVTTMQSNVDNYKQVNSLPNFRLFSWFFVVPGALVILLAGWSLVPAERRHFTLHPTRPSPTH
jgi:hypothetical protein